MKISNFKKFAGPVITRRAEGYLAEGRVKLDADESAPEAGMYSYRVFGSHVYNVRVRIDGDDIMEASCNCPYSYSGLCKHVTAVLMDIRERLESDAGAGNIAQQEPELPKNELGLTEVETFVLCYLAFTGQESYNRTLSKLPKGLISLDGLTLKAFGDTLKQLRKAQWMRKDGYVGAVNPAKVMKPLIMLAGSRRDWLNYFEAQFRQSDYCLYLTDVAKILSGGTVPVVHFCKRDYRYYGDSDDYVKAALIQVVGTATPEQIGAFLDDSLICDLARNMLTFVLEYDLVDYLDSIAVMLSKLKHANAISAGLYSRYRLAAFYAKAVELPERAASINYHETYYLNAAKALLSGDVDGSIASFKEGLKIQNRNSTAKNIPDDCISFFLYIVALSTRHNGKDVAALTTILKKRYDRYFSDRSFLFPLVAFFSSSDQEKETCFIDSARRCFPDGGPYARNVVAALTACFFGMKEKWIQKFPDPKMGVLRKECEHYFGEALSNSEEVWPFEAVLPKIPVRQVWELQIQELLGQVRQIKAGKEQKTEESRLYYLCRSSRYVEVREQGRLAGGGWSKGKDVSLLRYKTGDCPMDEIDKKIYSEWLKGDSAYDRYYAQRELPSLELVLPFLVGTDKLAIPSRGPLCLAEVREEKPFIWTEKRDGEIFFGTNVPKGVSQYSSFFLDNPSPTKFVIYRMPADIIPAYNRILGIGHLPLESEPMLEMLFDALRGRLEVHSDISGGISLPKVEGASAVTVRIVPDDDADWFELTALVRPLEGGKAEFFPGNGDDTVYDSRDGERAEVVRNRRREAANLKKVNALLPENVEFSADAPSLRLDISELLEFMEGVSLQQELVVLEWPEGEAFSLHRPDTSKWEINVTGRGGWYELEGDLAVSDDKVLSVQQLLSLVRGSRGRYVRIGEKEFLQLSEGLRRQLERIDLASQESHGKLRVPGIAMAVMGDALAGEIALDEPDKLLELRERIRRSRNVTYDVPLELNATLRDYQEDGFQWLMRVASWGAGACLADDMGLGKTVQAIAFMLSLSAEGPSLVVAPASVVANWQRELARFAPTLKCAVLSGQGADARSETLNSLGPGCVLMLTYGLLVSENERLASIRWNVACLDEAHTIKNRDTKTSASAMKLDAAHRLILTGTPVQNHLGELWNLFRFINPGLLATYEQFCAKYMSGGAACASELRRVVAPFLLRRTKQEVVRELPDKEEIVVPVTLSDEETAVYEVIRREAVSEVSMASAVSVNALSMITKLRMAACASSLAEKKWKGGPCSKIEAFLDKLLPIVEGGNSVLVFSQFTSFLSMAAAALEKAGIADYLYLDGQTPVTKRQKLVDAFQKGEHKVFLISLKAGGLGLNLTGANYVIHLDPWWNPAIEQQATDRAYRIGQSQKVTVYHLISSQTIEEKILRLHATKRNLADSILEGSNANNRLTPEELLEMLS